MPLLPHLDSENRIVDGSFFHLLPFCKKNCTKDKCQAYYNSLKNANAGSYCCPYGLSSYVYTSPEGRIIFTGLRIKGIYDKKKAKQNKIDNLANITIAEETFSNYSTERVETMEAQFNDPEYIAYLIATRLDSEQDEDTEEV